MCQGKTMILRGICPSTGFVERVPKYQPVVENTLLWFMDDTPLLAQQLSERHYTPCLLSLLVFTAAFWP